MIATSNKRENVKHEKYQELKKKSEKMGGVKASVVIGAYEAITPRLGEWLQQIPGITSDVSVQKSAVKGTANILRRTLRLPGLW